MRTGSCGIGFGIDALEAQGLFAHAAPDDALEAHKGPAANKQNICSVDGGEFLVRVLAPSLRGNVGHGALEDLEQGLLHALAGDVASNGRVLVLAANLVDFVDIDDALLGAGDVAVGSLKELQDDVLDILAHVAGLGKGGGVHNGEWPRSAERR